MMQVHYTLDKHHGKRYIKSMRQIERTYKIDKGHQYNRAGVRVQFGTGDLLEFWAWADSPTCWGGDIMRLDDKAAILSAVEATLADGQHREIVIKETAAPEPILTPLAGLCPRCHTWCYGDCRS